MIIPYYRAIDKDNNVHFGYVYCDHINKCQLIMENDRLYCVDAGTVELVGYKNIETDKFIPKEVVENVFNNEDDLK